MADPTDLEQRAAEAAEIKRLRNQLGLSTSQMSHLLDTNARTLRSYEAGASASTARPAAPRVLRLLRAYAAGYRPDDWPR